MGERELTEDGFRALMGRAPTDDDLVIPSSTGKHRNSNYSLRCFHEELERIGIPRGVSTIFVVRSSRSRDRTALAKTCSNG